MRIHKFGPGNPFLIFLTLWLLVQTINFTLLLSYVNATLVLSVDSHFCISLTKTLESRIILSHSLAYRGTVGNFNNSICTKFSLSSVYSIAGRVSMSLVIGTPAGGLSFHNQHDVMRNLMRPVRIAWSLTAANHWCWITDKFLILRFSNFWINYRLNKHLGWNKNVYLCILFLLFSIISFFIVFYEQNNMWIKKIICRVNIEHVEK